VVSTGSLYLGTQGWSYDSWVGSFYPPGIPQNGWLEAYAAEFNTVELDTTFYAIPRPSTVSGWLARTPENFRFAAKFPQAVTHVKQLVACQPETVAFLGAMTGLGNRLGPLLLQMPPSFSAGQADALESFVHDLPTGFHFALEVRHRSWLAKEIFPRLVALLKRHGIALCLVQHAWMPKLDEVTAPFAYIRWLGRREDIPDDDYSHLRIDRRGQLSAWAEQIARYLEAGVTVYGYFNNHYQGHSPASVRDMQARLAGL
jgi:uncharacterized protein YecE (DUF72 family)